MQYKLTSAADRNPEQASKILNFGIKNSMENIEIIKVGLSHLEELQKIGKQTFFETFSSTNTEKDMQEYLEKNFHLDKLKKEVENPQSEFYFAKENQAVIGYLKVNFGQAQTEIKEENTLEIERIYVLNEFHGKKVGQKLYEKALAIAHERNAEYLWLGVWEKNAKAIRFYEKNGFVAFDKHIFVLGSDAQTDIMMKLKL